ncbi:MAG: HAMP domain-containing protein [Granulosicoccus sp.]|nr:HAMP domain-containing protein [Granulosicoccus sp.]
MRLKYQLFITLLLGSGLLIALMYAFNSWSFNRGFLGYINKTEVQKLQPMIDELASGFESAGNWDWITSDMGRWLELVNRHLASGRPPKSRDDRSPGGRRLPPPDIPIDGQIDNRRRNGSGSGRSLSTLTVDPRLLLADSGQSILIGRNRQRENPADEGITWLPIRTDDRLHGYLGYRNLQQLPGQLDQVFAAQQKRSFAYAAMSMIILSALLALALAARIVRPLQTVNSAVNKIGQGNYKHRIASERGDEIGDLSRNINRLASTLDRNLSARQQWLAEISHELRTPVAVLQGELEALLDGVNPIDEDAIKSLHSESLRLARLIDDLHSLTISDIGALNYRFEPLELATIIAGRCHRDTALASGQSISLEVHLPDTPIFVRGDRQRLEQLVDNLLQNSLRYTDSGGIISIRLESHQSDAVITWEDTAPGVTDEQLPQLFDSLYRTETSRNRETGGTGLGLTIVRKIVEAHEGEITASHSALGGLRVQIKMPLESTRSI